MTWKDFDILTQRRSSRPLMIRNENPAYHDPECTLVMDSKGYSMRWTMIYLMKSLCAEQCVDLDGVHTIEMQLTP